jgi:hypothetical protein
MFCMITNIYNKKTKGPTLMEGHVAMVGRTQYVPPLPRELAVILTRITAAVNNIDAPMLTRVART